MNICSDVLLSQLLETLNEPSEVYVSTDTGYSIRLSPRGFSECFPLESGEEEPPCVCSMENN